MGVACVTEHVDHSMPPRDMQKRKSGGSLSLVIRVAPAGVWFLSLAMISAGGSPKSGMSSVSLLLVAMSMILGCLAEDLSMIGDVARAGCLVWLDGTYLDPVVAG